MSVEQHPIPQQITNYEFKLIGDMTINQFARAGGGIILALIINASPLAFFVKYPLMALFGLGGLALAFVPLSDRPLEKWLLAFMRSLYSPTIFTWQKKTDANWLEIDLTKKIDNKDEEEPRPQKDTDKVAEFVASLPQRESGQIIREDVDGATGKKVEPITPTALDQELKIVLPVLEKVEENLVRRDWDTEGGEEIKKEKLGATGIAVFGAIPMPDKPADPNILVGMVTDRAGKIVEGAIVEIQDSEGNSSRVLKTNSLGQFKTATPLSNGKYLLITERDGLVFDRITINTTGKIVDPVKIQAQA